MTEKVFSVLIAQLEEAAVLNWVHKNEAWSEQLEKSRNSLMKVFKKQQEEIDTLSDHCARLEKPIIEKVLSKGNNND